MEIFDGKQQTGIRLEGGETVSSNSGSIVVVGSSNMDLVAKAVRIPVVGETLMGSDFFMVPGGKGANQAVAAAKLGAEVIFVAKLGKDVFASKSLENFKSVGISTKHIEQLDGVPSGVAIIAIDEQGKNIIIVVPGANGKLTPADVDKAKSDIANASVVVAQLEIPIETVEQAAKVAQKNNIPFILDPAPARPLSDELLSRVDIIKPNETEAEILTGIKVTDQASAAKAADVLLGKGVKAVIITLGEKGLMLATKDHQEMIPSNKVSAVDSTAAGDAFTGSLACRLALGDSLRDAAVYANVVAAISVTRLGAQPSMPTREEAEVFSVD
ncbi:MAG: ribokinase [Deltaproteobacteria bacterium]|nr:MAG: ribokinase [Deltaproteobacteria bacterium]